jgi:hypothetical protein
MDEIEVELVVDGKKVPMNPYVMSVFYKVIKALISTLKGVDEDWKVVEIRLER